MHSGIHSKLLLNATATQCSLNGKKKTSDFRNLFNFFRGEKKYLKCSQRKIYCLVVYRLNVVVVVVVDVILQL